MAATYLFMCLKYTPLCSDFCFVQNPFHALSSARSLCLGSQKHLCLQPGDFYCTLHIASFCSARWPFVVEFANVSNWKQTQLHFISLILLRNMAVRSTEAARMLPAQEGEGGLKLAAKGTRASLTQGGSCRGLWPLGMLIFWMADAFILLLRGHMPTALSLELLFSLLSSCSGVPTMMWLLWFPAELVNRVQRPQGPFPALLPKPHFQL